MACCVAIVLMFWKDCSFILMGSWKVFAMVLMEGIYDTNTGSYNNEWVYFPPKFGDIIEEWLVFFGFSGYCFCGETVVTICIFNKLDGDIRVEGF